jgi:DNA repair protein RadC
LQHFYGSFVGMTGTETLRIIHFDPLRRVLAVAEYAGEATRVVLPLRAVIGEALRLGTTGLLLSHNHPSGDPTPSAADIATTQKLMRAAEALGIRVHDHLVIGADRRVSFRAAGLL